MRYSVFWGFYATKVGSSETTFQNDIAALYSRLKVFLNCLTRKKIRWVNSKVVQPTNYRNPLTTINYSLITIPVIVVTKYCIGIL